jgi:hypothetical protein
MSLDEEEVLERIRGIMVDALGRQCTCGRIAPGFHVGYAADPCRWCEAFYEITDVLKEALR